MRKKVTPLSRVVANKTKAQKMEYPISVDAKLKELLIKYDIGIQPLFDYLVVSGVVFLKRDVLEVINSRKQEFKDRFKRAALARFKKEKVVPDMKRVVCQMYEKDFDALNRFCIEENVKKYWIFEILITEFVKENPVLVAHIESCKRLKISSRKNQIDRLKKVEYVAILDHEDAEAILLRNTQKYDSKEYSGQLQQELNEILQKGSQLAQGTRKIETEDEQLDKLIARLRLARGREASKIAEQIIDDD